MSQPNPSTALAVVLVDELVRNAVDFVVLSPGSRSAALALAADANDRVSVQVVIDERSAGFWALGRAKATGRPAAVISTSGTAAANYLPAVVEAEMSMTPLVVITADRPVEMRGVGANQTIDQIGLFGGHVRHSRAIEAPTVAEDGNDVWRSAVSEAVQEARGRSGRAGAVHLNVAFREPTVPVSDDGRSQSAEYNHPTDGRPGGQPWLARMAAETPDHELEMPESDRGLVVVGDGRYDRLALLAAADDLGWPVLATALSGLRGRDVVSSYHLGLAGGVPQALRPEVVLAVGRVGPSQRLETLIAAADFRFRVDSSGRHIDPLRNATEVIRGDPVALLTAVPNPAPVEWAQAWRRNDQAVRDATSTYLAGLADPTGPGVADTLNGCDWETLVVASSLPIRDVDGHLARTGPVIGNRGASGIDGFVSTALGVASASSSTVALSGDLSLFHDSNGFLASAQPDLVMLVVDNGGGGLFDLLPQARHALGFERLFITPPDRDLAKLADLHRLTYSETDDLTKLEGVIASGHERGGVTLVRIPVDRKADLATRRALDEIGAEAARSGNP